METIKSYLIKWEGRKLKQTAPASSLLLFLKTLPDASAIYYNEVNETDICLFMGGYFPYMTMPSQRIIIESEDDIYFALSSVRNLMKQRQFTELDIQKVLVSTSELTRNILDHARSKGIFLCQEIQHGIQITTIDEGPGIPNVEEALAGKKSPGSRGLGLGLAGVKRLMDEFSIETSPLGTKITAIKRQGPISRNY